MLHRLPWLSPPFPASCPRRFAVNVSRAPAASKDLDSMTRPTDLRGERSSAAAARGSPPDGDRRPKEAPRAQRPRLLATVDASCLPHRIVARRGVRTAAKAPLPPRPSRWRALRASGRGGPRRRRNAGGWARCPLTLPWPVASMAVTRAGALGSRAGLCVGCGGGRSLGGRAERAASPRTDERLRARALGATQQEAGRAETRMAARMALEGATRLHQRCAGGWRGRRRQRSAAGEAVPGNGVRVTFQMAVGVEGQDHRALVAELLSVQDG